ncbi:MAG: ATP-binding protein [Epsilonproteobacteria bacterium]|nr:MAG: ATP-binding protein [Campylobacterota bacterium]
MEHLTAEQIQENWKPVLEHKEIPEIQDSYRKKVTGILLQNQKEHLAEQALHEAPTNVTGGVDKYDPVLISMVRRSVPAMLAFDIFGVQPMKGPTGLIFALRAQYGAQPAIGDDTTANEAQFNEADSGWTGAPRNPVDGTDPLSGGQGSDSSAYTGTMGDAPTPGTSDAKVTDPFAADFGYGVGMDTDLAETLGEEAEWAKMSFTIEKMSVEAKSRGLKSEYSVELAQDLKAIHGLSAEQELASIMSTEVTNEMNREILRRTYNMAVLGCQEGDIATPGTYDLDVDSNGRWSVERFKGLMFQIEREANAIAIATRRGKGNWIICSANVASALAMTGLLDTAGNTKVSPGNVDPVGNLFVGTMNGMIKVYVDPYVTVDMAVVGYKGSNAYDAGAYFCPYIPLTLYKNTHSDSFQPRLGFKTRYGIGANPFVREYSGGFNTGLEARKNNYFRIFKIENLM